MKSSEQLKALIRNKSKILNLNTNIILRSIIFEFFLEKLSLSKYVDKFIIKGGFLISAITNINLRSTMDLDVTVKSLILNKSDLEAMINEVISIPTIDLLEMALITIEEIHEGAEYPGFRVSIQVCFDKIKDQIKIDFTTGDILTPIEVDFDYHSMFEEKIFKLKSYNVETVLAEKLETIFSRGVLNTRMRDYYDIYILFLIKDREIDIALLNLAFHNTSTSRNTYEQINLNMYTVFDHIVSDQTLKTLWITYQRNFPYAIEVDWVMVMNQLKHIIDRLTGTH
jgi:predicted nucleotidyltransferase component of viral defense system